MSKEREPLVTHIFTADPSAHVFDDKIYIYPFLTMGKTTIMEMSIR